MKRSVLCLALAVLVAFPALGDDKKADDKDLKAARSSLKKNEKLVVGNDASEDPKGVDAAVAAVKNVRAAENDEAVRFLIKYAHEAVHEEVWNAIKAELAQGTDDEAVKAVVAILGNKDK